MERYEAYKDSGVEWIGEIPAEWNIKRIKYLATDESSLFIDGDWIESKDIVFDESQIRYITTGNIGEGWYKEQGLAYITNEKFIALNCTEIFPGDLIISRLNPPIGRSCIVPDLGARIVTSVDNVVLRPDTKYRKKYLMYSMCSNKYFEYTSLIARGATMQRISRSLLGDVALPIPSSVEEQTTIANFLDRKAAEIDTLIAQKERLLELYEEEKTAIINHAVTKGLDPNAELKDSGVEWLSEIPAEWEVKKLKYLVSINDESLPETTDKGFLIKYVDISNVKSGVGILSIEELSFSSAPSRARRIVREGDVIVSTVRTYLRSIARISNPPENLIASTGFAVIRPRKLHSDYTGYMFYSENLIGEIVSRSTGVSYPAISASEIGNIPVPIPNTKEQTTTANFLDRKITEIDAKIAKTQRIIELQKEYRTALISEVVTGKIKVPELPTQEASA